MTTINITNGECFNTLFELHHKQKGIPFNEAMMMGTIPDCVPFSTFFIAERSKALQVSEQQYTTTLSAFLSLLPKLNAIQEITLWFGYDAFCQMNLLTLLAYLDYTHFRGKVNTIIIDELQTNEEHIHVLEEHPALSLTGYYSLYQSVLVNHQPVHSHDLILNKAIDTYFDYLSDDGKLAKLIKKNTTLSEAELIPLLLAYHEYGIGDIQAKELIAKYKKLY